MIRTGIGFDAHRFTPDRKLILGGVHVPHEFGLAGHSDADVLVHAICDALLGALAEGDIGAHFPDSDPRWKDANSLDILDQVRDLVKARKARVANIDAVLIAEYPRIAPYREAMRKNLGRTLDISLDKVSVKATTMEGMGAVGRKEGIAAMSTVTLEISDNE